MSGPTPYERLDALERVVQQQQTQIAQLAASHAALCLQFASLCTALGQSVDALPGEKPIAQETQGRKGRH